MPAHPAGCLIARTVSSRCEQDADQLGHGRDGGAGVRWGQAGLHRLKLSQRPGQEIHLLYELGQQTVAQIGVGTPWPDCGPGGGYSAGDVEPA